MVRRLSHKARCRRLRDELTTARIAERVAWHEYDRAYGKAERLYPGELESERLWSRWYEAEATRKKAGEAHRDVMKRCKALLAEYKKRRCERS